jgi:hypothetical protein
MYADGLKEVLIILLMWLVISYRTWGPWRAPGGLGVMTKYLVTMQLEGGDCLPQFSDVLGAKPLRVSLPAYILGRP